MSAWILSLLVFLSPPERDAARHSVPTHVETPAQRLVRMQSIAVDVATVIAELDVDDKGKRWATALLVAVAWHESAFAPDVDLGPCYRDKVPARCDGGRAKCLVQIQGHPEVEGDRLACLRLGLRAIQSSLRMCRRLPEAERLAGLSGSCDRGRAQAPARWRTALALYSRDAAP